MRNGNSKITQNIEIMSKVEIETTSNANEIIAKLSENAKEQVEKLQISFEEIEAVGVSCRRFC